MSWIVKNLWLIPALPILAAGLTAVTPQRGRKFSATLAIGSLALSFLLSLCAFAHALKFGGPHSREIVNFFWLQFGDPDVSGTALKLGWVLDPLAAVMLVMVSLVGLLVFIYSLGYMARDENVTRFFCFMSLFAGAMLGLVIANSLLLLFICWELVGLTSYLLIGFWHYKPSAAAAAKKAFITTRIGDVALLLGMVWLYSQTGTLLFYDQGGGCLENEAVAGILGPAGAGWTVLMGISLLIFLGAAGKSGQVPLHVWLPDAMEGPTPVSALIHAATMVAAGVFLVARVFPLMKPDWNALAGPHALISPPPPDATLVITWVGAVTALFAASIAVAQTDIKRILAYSTISQLGYMMLGLGVGGVAVGMFHLITHAFFKALLFLGAGSVIRGCQGEQDIRRMGGLRPFMPVTFATYAVGMLSLSGFPLVFSGFWSKDAILHAARHWSAGSAPFFLGLIGAFLTAFYMTRQVVMVFFGSHCGCVRRSAAGSPARREIEPLSDESRYATPHESPAVMTLPLLVLAALSILPGFIGTPFWPWFQRFLGGAAPSGASLAPLMALSSALVFAGLGLGWWCYGRKPARKPGEPDVLERLPADLFLILRNKYWVDEFYEHSVVAFNAWWSRACDWIDTRVWNGAVQLVSCLVLGLAWVNRFCDEHIVNSGFDEGCGGLERGGKALSRLQDGSVQHYLRFIGIGLVALALLLMR